MPRRVNYNWRKGAIPIIDIFAGPGGLGEGFSAYTDSSGTYPFRIALSVEKDAIAHKTLLLRSFYRQFDKAEVPPEYFQRLQGILTTDELFKAYPEHALAAQEEAWHAELGSDATPPQLLRERVESALSGTDNWALIGGPPCQAYSLAGRSRNKGREGYRLEDDPKARLYLEYLQLIADFWPSVFVMENVRGLLSSTLDGQKLFDEIRTDLADPAAALDHAGRSRRRARKHRYSLHSLASPSLFGDLEPSDFVIRCEQFGIPQARHRVIIIGIRDDVERKMLPQIDPSPAPSVESMIGDLPKLRSGLSKETDTPSAWAEAILGICSTRALRELTDELDENVIALFRNFSRLRSQMMKLDRGGEYVAGNPCVQREREWFVDERIGGFCNHSTRGHIKRDLHRYLFAALFAEANNRSAELGLFPAALLPNHRNVALALTGSNFADRFRVQVRSRHATTITSHISKDGHYYIHYDPVQCRSLTVREAARLQTFPDSYYFEGPRTAQYIQVGNAVPPLLARKIAQSVSTLFG